MAIIEDAQVDTSALGDERRTLLDGEFSLAISLIDLDSLTIVAASNAFIEQTGLTAADVLRHSATALIAAKERNKMMGALRQLEKRHVEFYTSKREPDARILAEEGSFLWTRVWPFDAAGKSFALNEMNIGLEPKSFIFSENFEYSRHDVVVGLIDGDGIVTSVSSQVRDVLGVSSEELIGHRLFTASEEQHVRTLVDDRKNYTLSHSVALRMARRDQQSEELEPLCILTALAGTTDQCFIISLHAVIRTTRHSQRTSQLELHLVRIAQEIQASRVLDSFDRMTPDTHSPQIDALNARQLEVLRRLLRAERVSSIATALFISPSAVRNTLSEIFQKFGVHSQAELLDLLSNSDVSQLHQDTLSIVFSVLNAQN
jgi:DNA-binding CsgD family transcriptional regulator/PAS domain-containing protein